MMTTDFQLSLYKYISSYVAANKQSPTFLEMTAAMGISPRSKSLITRSLRALSKDGKIVLKREGRRLLISLTSKNLTLVGRISAGIPIEAINEPQSLNLNELIEVDNRFALQVKGNSMIDDGIFDGDIILCKQADVAREGEIIVALIDQHNTTLKRISYKVKGMITLIPSNPELKPKAYSPDRIQIQGIYVGLIRLHP
jgi:repressor LexA